MYPSNKITNLLNIEKPIIQAGMVWVSGGKLAAAASNCGCLGIVGAGSMKPELLDQHLKKAKQLSKKPNAIGVNIPLLYKHVEEQIEVSLRNGIRTFFTSAGSAKKYTPYLKEKGATVIHVCSSPLLAKKCEDAGVDAIVAEGFEAGGHNGRDEITTMCLIPEVIDTVRIPVIAAGGIGDARTMMAAFSLGADAVQMGTRFLMTKESSAHQKYKDLLINVQATDTLLTMKDVVAVRLYKNKFFQEIVELEKSCATKEKIAAHLGRGRAKAGMLDGDLENGELELGQIASLLKDIPTCQDMINQLEKDFKGIRLLFATK